MKIAIYDYLVTPNNPAGSCHRAMISALAEEHEFTVFSTEFDNPRPAIVSWTRLRAIRRPLAVLFLTFHAAAIVQYFKSRQARQRFAIVQSIESNVGFGNVVYSHFCHRWFLKNRWKNCGANGLRGAARWVDHALHAAVEPWRFRRAKWIVSPSKGLAKELCTEYPFVESKIHVIPNPVDVDLFSVPSDFDRKVLRSQLGFEDGDQVIAFVALGQFERKGLPLIFEALTKLGPSKWKVVVVGGKPDLVNHYAKIAQKLGLSKAVRLVGNQTDIRAYLWAADLFALPSLYEVFPLVALQAAAAACPILVTRLNGAEEFLVDGVSCLVVEANATSVAAGLRRFEDLQAQERLLLGERARASVQAYRLDRFAAAWRNFYEMVSRESDNE